MPRGYKTGNIKYLKISIAQNAPNKLTVNCDPKKYISVALPVLKKAI